ncbi:hypothetical protein J437_LFUL017638 [Ladona fulva]|uniref:Uncharacterized protein n=1 Tax=Ladona fulva TaxID=123851 RepID=A0A8K0KX78_LADFU|nr:hypothetical protein J437_LFUL017638 [Ladona fulva]
MILLSLQVVIIGIILLMAESSAYRSKFNATQFVQKQGNAPSRDAGIRSNTKLYRLQTTQTPSIMDHMKGKAFFYYRPHQNPTVNQYPTLERKSGQSLRISQKTVNDTIREVEAIMRVNPEIPHLSRQEMINIIENITNSNNYSSAESSTKNFLGESREEYIRSLMLVMPFHTNNLSDSMIQDLYTKPPITEIIDTTPTTTLTTNEWKIVVEEMSTKSYDETKRTIITRKTTEHMHETESTERLHAQRRPTSSTESYDATKGTTVTRKKMEHTNTERLHVHRRPTYTPRPSTPANNGTKYKNKYSTFGEPPTIRRNATTTQNPSVRTKEPDDSVLKITFTTEKPTTVYQYPESGIRRVRPKTTKAPFIVTATSVTPKPFKRLPAEITIPSPLKKDTVLIRDDVKDLLASIGLFPPDHSAHASTTTTQQHKASTTPPPFPMDIKQGVNTLTPEMQSLMKSFGLLDNEIASEKVTPPKEITQPPVFNPPPPEPTVDIGSYTAFKPLPIQAFTSNREKQRMGNEMKEFLASYGLITEEESDSSTGKLAGSDRKHKSTNTGFSVNERKFEGAEEDSIENQSKEENGTKPATAMNLTIDTDMLPTDMKNVLRTLGLVPTLSAENEPNKNIPSDFTLVTTTTMPEVVTLETTSHITDITKRIESDVEEVEGTKTSTEPHIKTTTTENALEEEHMVTEGHIFNPSVAVHDQESIENLSKILKTVRLLANGTSPDEMESLLGDKGVGLLQSDEGKQRKEKMTSLEQAENPPDPLSFEELVQIINSAKNEVKRQQPDSTTSGNGTDSTEKETPTIEASDSSDRSPSIEDLAASFGGTNGEEEESELPPPRTRPNGLYFLLDWNSFLEVGEDNSRVNLRFAPKVGDSRNFLPVTVP